MESSFLFFPVLLILVVVYLSIVLMLYFIPLLAVLIGFFISGHLAHCLGLKKLFLVELWWGFMG